MFDVDVLIATSKKLERLDNLICQVHTVLNSGINSRVTVAMEGFYPEFICRFTDEQFKRIRIIDDAPQGSPSIPIKYCMENIEWSDWLYSTADDDCLLPWGLKHLMEATKDVSMVIGQTLGVSRQRHFDLSAWKIGREIIPCHVSSALINMRSLEMLPKPWLEIDPLSDYFLIEKMSGKFPYKIIPSVISVQAFAELENLGQKFSEDFNKIYGHLV